MRVSLEDVSVVLVGVVLWAVVVLVTELLLVVEVLVMLVGAEEKSSMHGQICKPC